MVRVAGLNGQVRPASSVSADGLTARRAARRLIRTEANELMREQDIRWASASEPSLPTMASPCSSRELARERQGLARPALSRSDLPDPHAARDRSGASFPVHPNRGFCLAAELKRRKDGDR